MSYTLTSKEANQVLKELRKTYRVFAPKRFPKQGRYSDTDIIKYDEISTVEEIEFKEKSTFPAKEVMIPIHRTLFYITEEENHEAKGNMKPILLLGRACDINAQKVQARIYCGNGGFDDPYYKRLHDQVKYVLMECPGGSDTCFCVSMGTNKTDDYAMAIRMDEECGLKVEVKDPSFDSYFADSEKCRFTPKFIEENELSVKPKKIKNKEILNKLKKDDMWREFDKRCISCGACTVACSTCTCFTTRDIVYGDNTEAGERRRVTDSCQVAGFDQMAGQREIRSRAGDRMRYKVLHKFHDYDARFHEGNMCVGCGRCIDRCPEFISIATTVDKMNKAITRIEKEEGKQAK